MSFNIDRIKSFARRNLVLLAIIALGLVLRLYGSLSVHYFTVDENRWRSLADQVSFSPRSLNLVTHGDHHPFLEVYVIKLSTIVFNRQLFGFLPPVVGDRVSYRTLQVILCSLTVLIVYLLASAGLGRKAGLISAFLLAVSQFHIHFSRTVVQIGPLMFFAAVSLLFFWKSLSSRKYILLTGVSVGFAFLSEESAVFLPIIFMIYLLLTRRLLCWLRLWETYAAVAIIGMMMVPELYWNLANAGSSVGNHLAKAGQFNGISLLSTTLYLGELFTWFAPNVEKLIGGIGKGHIWPLEYPPMGWMLGGVCLIAVGAAIRERANDFVKLMLTVFGFVFLFFTVFASKGLLGNFNYYWASMSTIPAIILAGMLVAKFLDGRLWMRWLAGLVLAYLVWSAASFLSMHDQIYIRRPEVLGQFYSSLAEDSMLRGNYEHAATNLEKALTCLPDSTRLRSNLMECYRNGAKPASSLLASGMAAPEADSKYLFDRGYIKEWMVGEYQLADGVQKIPQEIPANGDQVKSLARFELMRSSSAVIAPGWLRRARNGTSTHAYTNLYAAESQRVRFWLMVDGGASVWLNGDKIYDRKDGKLLWIADQEEVGGLLRKGWNELVLRMVSQGDRNGGFAVKMTAENGDMVDCVVSAAKAGAGQAPKTGMGK